jgi:hypothetical protein
MERTEKTWYEYEETKFQGYKGEPEVKRILINGGNGNAPIIDEENDTDDTLIEFINAAYKANKTGMDWAWSTMKIDRDEYRDIVRCLESVIKPKGKGWDFDKEKYPTAQDVISKLFPNQKANGFLDQRF